MRTPVTGILDVPERLNVRKTAKVFRMGEDGRLTYIKLYTYIGERVCCKFPLFHSLVPLPWLCTWFVFVFVTRITKH